MSLRARLVLVVLVLTGVGLMVSGVTTTSALRSYLLRRLDDRLADVEPFAVRRLTETAVPTPSQPFTFDGVAAAPAGGNGDVVAARFDAAGNVVREFVPPFSDVSTVLTSIPDSVLAPARNGDTAWTEATIAGVHYRIVVEPIPETTDVAAVMAPLGEVDATVERLQFLAIGVGAVLLVVAGAAGLWLVRLGLRPLAHMADTADAIAVGDLDRRVDASGGTEVETLAHALNNAFDARQASEQRLRQFVTDASHELRTPLTSIRGYAELLRRGVMMSPDDTTRAVTRIEAEATRMGGLVDDLLLLARLDQGRPLESASVDLTALAHDAVSDARAIDPARSVTLVTDTTVLVDRADERRLRQVITNLLANTREHTPAGTPVTVTVSTTGGVAVVTVTDSGPGLSASALAHAFDRFWRDDDARAHRPGALGGSGLGLAIVAAIAAAHGGTVSATNADRGGACFTVTLPHARESRATHNQFQGDLKEPLSAR